MSKLRYFPFKPSTGQTSYLFPKNQWKSRGNCWVNLAKQGTDEWLNARKGQIPASFLFPENPENESASPTSPSLSSINRLNTRITGSNFGAAAGRSRFSSCKELALEVVGIKEKVFSEESMKNMAHGTKEEPNARRWYENQFGVEVEEIGLVVPKWNFHLGASVDGIVKDAKGIIEIKCPKKMYAPLTNHMALRSSGWTPSRPYYRSHIWPTHYDQMQGGMAILGMEWCDYIVYSTSDQQVYYERILFNSRYWTESLYPNLQTFLNQELFPLIEDMVSQGENYPPPKLFDD